MGIKQKKKPLKNMVSPLSQKVTPLTSSHISFIAKNLNETNARQQIYADTNKLTHLQQFLLWIVDSIS